jgi:hypothetical protein
MRSSVIRPQPNLCLISRTPCAVSTLPAPSVTSLSLSTSSSVHSICCSRFATLLTPSVHASRCTLDTFTLAPLTLPHCGFSVTSCPPHVPMFQHHFPVPVSSVSILSLHSCSIISHICSVSFTEHCSVAVPWFLSVSLPFQLPAFSLLQSSLLRTFSQFLSHLMCPTLACLLKNRSVLCGHCPCSLCAFRSLLLMHICHISAHSHTPLCLLWNVSCLVSTSSQCCAVSVHI